MHLPRKLFQKRFLQSGLAARLTPEQRERLLDSVDADVEALLLDVDLAERDIHRALESVDPDSDADLAALASLKEELDKANELKEWCRAKRAEIAELVS